MFVVRLHLHGYIKRLQPRPCAHLSTRGVNRLSWDAQTARATVHPTCHHGDFTVAQATGAHGYEGREARRVAGRGARLVLRMRVSERLVARTLRVGKRLRAGVILVAGRGHAAWQHVVLYVREISAAPASACVRISVTSLYQR